MITLLSWNVHGLDVTKSLMGSSADVALLQEVRRPSVDGLTYHPSGDGEWLTSGWESRAWRTAIVVLKGGLVARLHTQVGVHAATSQGLLTSRPGSLTVADLFRDDELLLTVASAYAAWERPPGLDAPIFADASAHRLLSDLSAIITGPTSRTRLVVAGDFNILHGYGEDGSSYWAGRYESVFDRAAAIGLRFVGPQSPNGRQADPWPTELPVGSRDVPTFVPRGSSPASASRQLDFVFATANLSDGLTVRAMNELENWGPSDHCQILIDIDL